MHLPTIRRRHSLSRSHLLSSASLALRAIGTQSHRLHRRLPLYRFSSCPALANLSLRLESRLTTRHMVLVTLAVSMSLIHCSATLLHCKYQRRSNTFHDLVALTHMCRQT
ncbi:hypothetical protein AUEXF2481DRAFT_666268 [Aureobasidium subglaciale EXF-2481]|uniref:Uncharacterized protein n=1 Tax=Aureobasidium subglaciale (strain EXF-2481) TaxID=1043005 RepID=A0A074YQ45_AURSE|nr:uncharacterized protein AUEXF2481DRAFT_666268 [Aureobasidium subglaciale EXF-2481]KEQ96167.1 hypothetical protein AUEXF2481DRAFT_666268 [Aureobasidium subglaciale EXF-2481]